jgi:hypothetical protein
MIFLNFYKKKTSLIAQAINEVFFKSHLHIKKTFQSCKTLESCSTCLVKLVSNFLTSCGFLR